MDFNCTFRYYSGNQELALRLADTMKGLRNWFDNLDSVRSSRPKGLEIKSWPFEDVVPQCLLDSGSLPMFGYCDEKSSLEAKSFQLSGNNLLHNGDTFGAISQYTTAFCQLSCRKWDHYLPVLANQARFDFDLIGTCCT